MKKIDIENKKHIRKTYTDKASSLLNLCKNILIFSFFTYLLGIFIYQSFDFGLIFEFISWIFVLRASHALSQNNLSLSKKYIIISMIPIGWLIIYDMIILLANITPVLSLLLTNYASFGYYFYSLLPYLADIILITIFFLLYNSLSSLQKADGYYKTENYNENFYDSL